MDDKLRDDFRGAMRRLAATVALITTGRSPDWGGMAATAVTSVCADPPTLLVSVNRNASIHPIVLAEQCFRVNLLADRHKSLVGIFSGERKGLQRFEAGRWIADARGLPVLSDALASISCSLVEARDISTHTLFVGRVDSVTNHDDITPLLWVDGRFAHASE